MAKKKKKKSGEPKAEAPSLRERLAKVAARKAQVNEVRRKKRAAKKKAAMEKAAKDGPLFKLLDEKDQARLKKKWKKS